MWLHAGLFGAGLFGAGLLGAGLLGAETGLFNAKKGICCAATRSSKPFISICKLSMSSIPGATASMMGVLASTGDGTEEATSRAPTVSTPQEANQETGSV